MIGSLAITIKNHFQNNAHSGEIKVALVGIGGWGAANALSIMRAKAFDIKCVYDKDPKRACEFGKRYKVDVRDSYDDIIFDKNLDAIVITVPNHMHFDMTKAALMANKNVFVEKPLSVIPNECLELNDLAAKMDSILMVGHQIRRLSAFKEIKKRIENRTYGMPLHVHAVRTLPRKYTDWRRNATACPGGSMEQLGIHFIDTLIYLFGSPLSWSGWGRNIPYVDDAPDWGHMELFFTNDVSCAVDSSFSSVSDFEFTIFFENGQLKFDGNKLYEKLDKNVWRYVNVQRNNGAVEQFIEFARCIEHHQIPETNALNSALLADILASLNKGT